MVSTLKALFWCALAAEIAWLVLATTAYGFVFAELGQKGVGLLHLLILGALALSAGLLLLVERSANPFDDPENHWALSEVLYPPGPPR